MIQSLRPDNPVTENLMTILLKIQSSLYGQEGASSRLADRFVARWQDQNPEGRVLVRDLAAHPLPHLDQARFQAFRTPAEERTAAQQELVVTSDALVAEIAAADEVVLAAPMYNFSVPSTLHTYFDHIARAGMTFRYTEQGPEGLLTGKRAWVFVTRGGVYGEAHAQDLYLRQFLGFVGITDVNIIHAEGLAMGDAAREQGLAQAEATLSRLLPDPAQAKRERNMKYTAPSRQMPAQR